MKKYIFLGIAVVVVAGGIAIGYAVVAPSRAAARDLAAINGLLVGQTTEAELLGRAAFQKVEYHCFDEVCMYSSVRTNTLLSTFHLAPRMVMSSAVLVRDGGVVQVWFYIMQQGLDPISVTQSATMPAGCSGSLCVVPPPRFIKTIRGVRIALTNESDYHNRFPEMVDTACLSRIRGCRSYTELLPFTKSLDLRAGNP